MIRAAEIEYITAQREVAALNEARNHWEDLMDEITRSEIPVLQDLYAMATTSAETERFDDAARDGPEEDSAGQGGNGGVPKREK